MNADVPNPALENRHFGQRVWRAALRPHTAAVKKKSVSRNVVVFEMGSLQMQLRNLVL